MKSLLLCFSCYTSDVNRSMILLPFVENKLTGKESLLLSVNALPCLMRTIDIESLFESFPLTQSEAYERDGLHSVWEDRTLSGLLRYLLVFWNMVRSPRTVCSIFFFFSRFYSGQQTAFTRRKTQHLIFIE